MHLLVAYPEGALGAPRAPAPGRRRLRARDRRPAAVPDVRLRRATARTARRRSSRSRRHTAIADVARRAHDRRSPSAGRLPRLHPAAPLARRQRPPRRSAGAAAVVGHRADGAGRRHDRRPDVVGGPGRRQRRPRAARPDRLRLRAVHVPGRPAAQPRRARRRGRRAAACGSARRPAPTGCAACWPRRSTTARCSSSTGSTSAAGSRATARRAELPPTRPRALDARSSSRASASARSCTTAACAPSPRCCAVAAAAALALRCAQSAWRPRCALARPHRRGRPGGAPAAGAQPARRRPAAARRALAHAADRPEPDRASRPRRRRRWSAPRRRSSRRALEELRELARGIHPAVLSDRGLQAAVEALAGALPAARSSSSRCRASGCPSRSRPRPTS